jgi:hypothetical protein
MPGFHESRHCHKQIRQQGELKTRMTGSSAPVSAKQSVAGHQRLPDRLTLTYGGHFFNHDGNELPW